MRLTRHTRFYAALLVLVSILFMQCAVAAYACPLPAAQTMAGSHAVNAEQMVGCSEDMGAPSALCQAHCQPDGQSLDRPVPPDASPFIATRLIAALANPAFLYQSAVTEGEPAFVLQSSSEPPVSVRNCCFRI